MDSNSVWEAPAQVSGPRAAVRPQQVSLRPVTQKLHGAALQERLQAASTLPPQELASALQERADAPAAWQQPGWEQEKSSVAPRAELRPALERLEGEARPRALLRQCSVEPQQGG
jgi:hypothetical protein